MVLLIENKIVFQFRLISSIYQYLSSMKKEIILIIFIVFTAASCTFFENMFGADEYDDLPSSKRFRYNEGDELLYKDDQNKIDTFTIYSIITDYRESDKKYHYQYQDIILKSKSTNTFKNIKIYYENNFFQIAYADNYILQYLNKIDPISITISNHLIMNAYNFNDTLVFHYQYGLLRYKDGNSLFEQIIE
jgi:hypothetical protein